MRIRRLPLLIYVHLFSILLLSAGIVESQSAPMLSRTDYHDRLQGMWLGESLANWTGLNTEGSRTEAPFFTDEDWGVTVGRWQPIDFIVQPVWGSDDDTDIEYVYLHLMSEAASPYLTPEQIVAGWERHINDFIWVSNRRARDLFDLGITPPATGLLLVNDQALMIDAQLTTEFFGALAPGLPSEALQLADLPIRTTAAGYAAHAAQFFVLLYSLAPTVDPALSARDQMRWLVEQARGCLPDMSKSADVIDFVLAEYRANPDPAAWETTRDRIYQRYHRDAAANGFVYRDWFESSVNLATGVMALLYGEGDFRSTVQIGTLSGWDSDNPTATLGGLLGLLYGAEAIRAQFPDLDLSDRYNIYRTREDLPDYLPDDPDAEDTFSLMADRMMPLIDRVVSDAGGTVTSDGWELSPLPSPSLAANPLWRLHQASANNRPGQPPQVEVGDVWTGGDPAWLMDGQEHDFSGEEVFEVTDYFMIDGDTDHQLILTVTYPRPVTAARIRLIEGDNDEPETGLVAAHFEVRINGEWETLQTAQREAFDLARPFQMIDFVLERPVEIEALRLVGSTGAANFVTLLELDVLAD
ncbi:MAG: ADP-ribosylglycohydrolase family protein [bacterium]|nr:ADP-ribosylglycohydrolase family protein [bacterium]